MLGEHLSECPKGRAKEIQRVGVQACVPQGMRLASCQPAPGSRCVGLWFRYWCEAELGLRPRSIAYELGDLSEAVKHMSPGVTICEVGVREPTSLSPRADQSVKWPREESAATVLACSKHSISVHCLYF